MESRYQFTTQEDFQQLLIDHADKRLIQIQHLTEGNFMVFGDKTPEQLRIDQLMDAVFPSQSADPKTAKLAEISAACKATITAGIDFQTTQGVEHFSLTDDDQINLMALAEAAKTAAQLPYHADGKACRLYTAAEITELSSIATLYKMYQTTYHNALKQYVQTLSDPTAIAAVKYGMELPKEYADKMAVLLGGEQT